MARVKTFANGSIVFPNDLDLIQDDYELAFSSYRRSLGRSGVTGTAPVGGTYALNGGDGQLNGAAMATPGSVSIASPFWLDPADFAAGSRTVKLRVRCLLTLPNIVAPGTNWTLGLYNTSNTLVSGSAATTITAPTIPTQAVGSDFTCPTAGMYYFAVVNSGSAAASSVVGIHAALMLRQV